jgi:hypothetical protein
LCAIQLQAKLGGLGIVQDLSLNQSLQEISGLPLKTGLEDGLNCQPDFLEVGDKARHG